MRPVVPHLLVLATCVLLAACGGRDSSDERGSARPLEAQAGVPVAAGDTPIAVAVTADVVWTLDQSGGTLSRFQAATGRRIGEPVRVGRSPLGIAIGEGAVWVLDGTQGVRRVDARTGRPARGAVAVADPTAIAAGAGGVWVTSRGPRTVTRFEPSTLRADPPIRVGATPTDVTVAGGSVWVSESDAGSLRRIDARTQRVFAPLRTGMGQVLALASGAGKVWAAVATTQLNEGVRLVSIDARSGTLDPMSVPITGGVPLRLAVGVGHVWATDTGTALPGSPRRAASVLGIAAGRNDPTDRLRIPLAGRPSAVATSSGALWVADSERGTLTRIALR